jgi:hypothetical protein
VLFDVSLEFSFNWGIRMFNGFDGFFVFELYLIELNGFFLFAICKSSFSLFEVIEFCKLLEFFLKTLLCGLCSFLLDWFGVLLRSVKVMRMSFGIWLFGSWLSSWIELINSLEKTGFLMIDILLLELLLEIGEIGSFKEKPLLKIL